MLRRFLSTTTAAISRVDQLKQLSTVFPKNEILTRPIPGKGVSKFVPSYAIIRRLNDVAGFDWTFHVVEVHENDRFVSVRVDLNIFGSSREAWGTSPMKEHAFATATTAAMRKAAKMFGVGLYLDDAKE